MAIGRPISLTPNVATKTLSSTATASQTSFTVTGGYRINELGVYRNGVRLVQGKDFTASDGSTVTLLSGATVDDIIDFQIFDSFNIADALNSIGNQSIDGELTATKFIGDGSELSGVSTANINTNNIQVSGITTIAGIATINANGSQITGLSTFDGNIHLLDNKTLYFGGTPGTTTGDLQLFHDASHSYIRDQGTGDIRVRASGFDVRDSANALSILRAEASGVMATTGIGTVTRLYSTDVNVTGIVSFTNTTASTSSATGALIVSGGVGIAGSLHVGENVSVGGTLTYEDVTNIDSVGIVTAQTGVKVTAGGIDITAGGLDVSAGISTFGGGDIQISGSAVGVTSVTWDASANSLIFKDSSIASFGNDTDLQIYHQDSINYIKSTNASAPIQLQAPAGEVLGKFSPNGSVDLYHNGNKKFETSNDGTVTTGIATASDFVIGAGGTSVHTALGTKASTGKAIAMAMVFG